MSSVTTTSKSISIYEELANHLNWESIPPTVDLPEEDGEPLEDSWHRTQVDVLIDSINTDKIGKENFYVGGNMFVYFMLEQVKKIGYKGPDFFFVKTPKEPNRYRGKWVVWLEDGKYPNVIIELLSPSTRKEDLTTKKELYEKVFRTSEYFCVDNEEPKLYGWRLTNQCYEEIQPDEKGYLFSEELGYKLGFWKGKYLGQENLYLRFFNIEYELIPTYGEREEKRAKLAEQRAELAQKEAQLEKERASAEFMRAELLKQRAEQEKARAEKLEQELVELKKKLGLL